MAEICPKEKITLIRRGMNAFPRFKPLRSQRSPARFLSIGRLVEKKGFPFQIEVYQRLIARGVDLEVRIVGYGPLRGAIEELIRSKGLQSTVKLMGRLPFSETLEQLQWADLLVHTGQVAASGDRDGLPNVLMEAQATGLPCLATRVSAIPELIEDRVTGVLVPPDDAAAMATALAELAADPALRDRLAQAGARRVRHDFTFDRGLDILSDRLGAVRPSPEARRA